MHGANCLHLSPILFGVNPYGFGMVVVILFCFEGSIYMTGNILITMWTNIWNNWLVRLHAVLLITYALADLLLQKNLSREVFPAWLYRLSYQRSEVRLKRLYTLFDFILGSLIVLSPSTGRNSKYIIFSTLSRHLVYTDALTKWRKWYICYCVRWMAIVQSMSRE